MVETFGPLWEKCQGINLVKVAESWFSDCRVDWSMSFRNPRIFQGHHGSTRSIRFEFSRPPHAQERRASFGESFNGGDRLARSL